MHAPALCMYERPSPGFCALCLSRDVFPPFFDAQLIQYAKSQGMKTINVVRRSSQFDELKALGCASQSFLEPFTPGCKSHPSQFAGAEGARAARESVVLLH